MSPKRAPERPEPDPLWYQDAIIYELHVRTFADSDGDGIGDFRGLTEKLDYLQDLGVTALWLLPFYPSPLRDDGYDIADYRSIHPSYGNLRDFRNFLRQAHKRGLRVIIELVVNHTSDQHPWFQRARRAKPGSVHRDFYVWSDTADRYPEARIIFKDFETSNWTWDPMAHAYYWHRFYHHQPDLNFESPRVQEELFRILDHWLGMGIDGLRLDAIPYLHEREGTNCENLPETHAFLKRLREHVDKKFSGRMLLAEANQWPEDAVAYFGNGDECHMSFHFPLMPRLFMALRMEDRFPVLDILEQTPQIPEPCQWAIFLRNHDELTLEMVTDEDRDYMYRVYATDRQARINLGIRRRLAPLLGNDRRRIELMNALLVALPGTPVLYYGDEVGMGDNFYLGDRNGVRTPMQWSPDRNAGFSRANPQKLYLPVIIDPEYHYEAVNVEAQLSNPHSLLWWTKRLIALGRRYRAFGRGTIQFLHPENHRVLAFLRAYRDERILVVANLSRFVQHVELDLSEFREVEPVELFGHTRFPRIGELPYLLTLGPHGFYWFSLGREAEEIRLRAEPRPAAAEVEVPALSVTGGWEGCLRGRGKAGLEAALMELLPGRRWFGGKAKGIRKLELTGTVPIGRATDGRTAHLALLAVEYADDEPETYALLLAFAPGREGEQILRGQPAAAVARVEVKGGKRGGLLYDALFEGRFCHALLDAIARRRSFKGERGTLSASPTKALRAIGLPPDEVAPEILKAEQSNTSVVFGDRFILKLFRKVEPGTNPDLEIGLFLTEKTSFAHTPPVAGALEYRRGREEPITLGILQGYVENRGDAWRYTLERLGKYFERALSRPGPAPESSASPLELAGAEVPPEISDLVGLYLVSAELLGRRTAELHLALAADAEDPAFAPEPFTTLYQRSLYQAMRSAAVRTFQLLERRADRLAGASRDDARRVLGRRGEISDRFNVLLGKKIDALRIRCHGDYHLGQVLYTGRDFVIIDFEGEPARPLSERRIKRSPLRDVAGMLRSFHYAAYAALREQAERGTLEPARLEAMDGWARLWYRWSAAAFLKSYLGTAGDAPILPRRPEAIRSLLEVLLLEKALYEVRYELGSRPGWVRIPLQGILQLLEE